jgi:hypothetical protein
MSDSGYRLYKFRLRRYNYSKHIQAEPGRQRKITVGTFSILRSRRRLDVHSADYAFQPHEQSFYYRFIQDPVDFFKNGPWQIGYLRRKQCLEYLLFVHFSV